MENPLPPGTAYPLPDVFAFARGGRVTGPGGWPKRRAELLALFEKEMYGPQPPPAVPERSAPVRSLPSPDPAVSLRIERWYLGPTGPLDVLISVPTKRDRPAPAFIGLNFESVAETLEGRRHHWGFVEGARRGFGCVVGCYEDVAPDRKSGLLYQLPYRAISLWAWGLSRLADGVETLTPELDSKRLAVVGHSRLGKAALLAGARDGRFALTIPSQSGCGGAAPSRGNVGESVARINAVFPHWFSERFKKYNDHPERLPFDQNGLLACIAPRALLLCNATEDSWANPDGQLSALEAASPVWSLLGADPSEKTATFIRPGKHAMTEVEWRAYLDFAEKVLR
jgi:hypothetical protein